MKRTFLNKPYPMVTALMAGQTPQELIAESRNAESDGADGIAIELYDLKPEFRNAESLRRIVDAVNLPFMFIFYRNDLWGGANDDQRQELLLAAAGAGAAMIDVMGDLYDPSPMEITRNPAAIEKQKRLIDAIHAKGAEVVISSHTRRPLTTEQVIEHMQEVEKRGSDVVKIVTAVDTEEELTEAFRTTMALRHALKKPFIHLCGGKFSRPHRFLGPALGVSILFAVTRYEPRYGLPQPTIKAVRAVLDNMRWNINDV